MSNTSTILLLGAAAAGGAYLLHKRQQGAVQAKGGFAGLVDSALQVWNAPDSPQTEQPTSVSGGSGLVDTLKATKDIATDPALADVTCNVLRIKAKAQGTPPPSCPNYIYTDAQKSQGIGLAAVAPTIRKVAWSVENPLGVAAIAGGVVGAIWLSGYAVGRNRK